MSGKTLRLLWDALAAQDCRPHGTECDFRARCPAHGGENPTALAVRVGADGRAVVWCHAHQCDVESITAALGLTVADLFPDGHHRGRRYPLQHLRRSDFDGTARKVVNVLFALERVGQPWQLALTTRCPYCGHPGAWLRADGENVDADCPEGCGAQEFTQALLGRLDEQGATT